ncbi:SURF1 family protein [Nocardioides sambongensis]|uniref:SURF1 family protein n=1 Tax=Nocardioides sambongensis TaxID=2589074 RepID=UPI00112B3684|nr:SURF1 family protein [Nocardioides sambongensis]
MADGGIRWWHPRMWGAHLLGLVCVAIATGMGVWQYDAWQERRAAEQVDLTTAEPVPLSELLGPDHPFPSVGLGRPVEISGTWLPQGTVLVDGREDADGADGLWVVTPLTDGEPDAPAIPVVRGWVPDGTDPADVPAVSGTADLVGWLQPGEGSGQTDPDPTDDVLPQVRIADLVQRVDQDLYGAYAVAQEPEEGLAPATLDQLPKVSRFTALRNILYAIEWWVFAAFAGYIWWRYVRDTTQGAPADDADDEERATDPVTSEA